VLIALSKLIKSVKR